MLRWCLNERGRVEETTHPWVIRGGRGPRKAIHVEMKEPGSGQEQLGSIMRVKSATRNCSTEETGS